MLTPPEKNSASTTRMRMPSRTSVVVTSIGVDVRQAEHVDGQACRHELVGAVALLDRESEQADDDPAVQRVRIPRTVGDGGGKKTSPSRVKKG